MKYLLVAACLISTPALSAGVPCSVAQGNEVLDILQAGSVSEVPILSGMMGDAPIKVTASHDGTFTVLMLIPDGTVCILAVGTGLKAAKPDERFAKEVSQ